MITRSGQGEAASEGGIVGIGTFADVERRPAIVRSAMATMSASDCGTIASRGASAISRLNRRVEHLAHHAEIVARREVGGADVEFAILVFPETLRPGDDHRADRIRALDVAVVVDLDAPRRPRQPKTFRQRREQLALRGGVGELAAERLARIGERVIDELLLLAAAAARAISTL